MDGDSKDFKSVFNIFFKKIYIFLDTSSCGSGAELGLFIRGGQN
jgi:hypothetical protein